MLCLTSGFEEDGSTKMEHVKFITKDSYPFAGALATFGGRLRLKSTKSNWKVTIGKRTTCFYQVENRQGFNFNNFPTKNVDLVSQFLQTLESESVDTFPPQVKNTAFSK